MCVESVENKNNDHPFLIERLVTESANIPIITFGSPLNEAKSASIFALGIAVPSYLEKKEGRENLESYYLPAARELVSRIPEMSATLIINWPGDGEGKLFSTSVSPDIYSLTLKERTIEACLSLVLPYSNLRKINIFGHSTAGGVLLRNADKLIKKDSRIRLVAEDPSAVGCDSGTIKAATILAQIGLMRGLAENQKHSKNVNSKVQSSYGPFPADDEWPYGASDRAIGVQEAMRAEANQKNISWEKLSGEKIIVTCGQKDRMVERKKLAEKCRKHGIPFIEIPGAGHLSARSVGEWSRAVYKMLS
jgi:hypothetical protein